MVHIFKRQCSFTPLPTALQLSALPALVSLGACGFGEQINSSIAEQERALQSEACKQALAQADVIVAQARAVLPQADAPIPVQLPHTQCVLHLVQKPDLLSLKLTTPDCRVETPKEASEVQLQMSLRDLDFSAEKNGSGIVSLNGNGHLDLSAQLPVLGSYSGQVSYQLVRSSLNSKEGSVDLHLIISYTSGQNSFSITVDAQGTRDNINGEIVGPTLRCKLAGRLDGPTFTCQQVGATPAN